MRNVQDAKGRTALHIAAEKGDVKIASTLLKRRVDHGLANEAGYTALDVFLENFDVAEVSFRESVWETMVHSMKTVREKAWTSSTTGKTS